MVVGGKEGAGADMALQILEGGPGESEAVEGGRAAAHLVEQDEGLRGGGVEDGSGFGHLHHKGGAAAGEIVGGADAGVDAVDDAVGHATGRNKAAHLREDDEERGLAEISGLAAHVGAGNQQQVGVGGVLTRVEKEIVGDKAEVAGVVHQALDDRMASSRDFEDRSSVNAGARVVAECGEVRKVGNKVDFGDGGAGAADARGVLDEFGAESGEDALLDLDGALLRGEDFGS